MIAWLLRTIVALAVLAGAQAQPTPPTSGETRLPEPRLKLQDTFDKSSGTTIRHGTFSVWENRRRQSGRILELDVVVLPAQDADARSDPIFYFAGGPGQNAAAQYRAWVKHWMRQQRDIVLVSQRGCGGNNRLTIDLPGNDENLQGYLDPIFQERPFRAGLEKLRQRFDLSQYSTFNAADDVNDLRIALGYDKINLYGGSYGSRAELVYVRQHPDTVRTAILNGVAPIFFKNPLYHARGAQRALDLIAEECAADPKSRAVFGDVHAKLKSVLAQLAQRPVDVTVRHPVTGATQHVQLTRDGFAEALRVIMYYNSRDVPLLIVRADAGNFSYVAQRGMEINRALRGSLAFGMLACVTCTEDVARIDPPSVAKETANSFLGDGRVRRQMAICSFWPKSDVPPDFAEPVCSDVPALFLSGTLDPVTPPEFGAEAARHFKNGLHVVVPGSHGVGGPCVESMMRAFLDRGSAAGLDTSCVQQTHLPPFNAAAPNPTP